MIKIKERKRMAHIIYKEIGLESDIEDSLKKVKI